MFISNQNKYTKKVTIKKYFSCRYFNGNVIDGETGTELYLDGLMLTDSGRYEGKAYNDFNTILSRGTQLDVEGILSFSAEREEHYALIFCNRDIN